MADWESTENGLGYDVGLFRRPDGMRDWRLVRGGAAIAQHIQMRLRTFLGESPYNRAAGVPYEQVIMRKGTTVNAVRAILENHILGTPGVTEVIELDLEYEPLTRKITGTGRVRGGGDVITVSLPEISLTGLGVT